MTDNEYKQPLHFILQEMHRDLNFLAARHLRETLLVLKSLLQVVVCRAEQTQSRLGERATLGKDDKR